MTIGVLLAFADRLLWEVLWIFGDALWILYIVIGLVLFTIIGLRAWRDRSRAGASLLAILITFSLGLWSARGWLAYWGDHLVFRVRFERSFSSYEQIVAAVTTSGVASLTDYRTRFVVDSGPPLRVAFPLPGGILDNWEGVIYDPTGIVSTTPLEVQKIFGGDLVLCEEVRGPYYRCWFT